MLFAQKLLAPGPQSKHPGKVNPPQADPPQSRKFTLGEGKQKESIALGRISGPSG